MSDQVPTPEPEEADWPSEQVRQEMASQQPVEPPPEEPQFSVRDYLQSRGYDASGYEGDDDLLSALEEGWATAQRYQPVINEYEQHREDFERWRQSQGQAEPEPEVKQPERPKYAPPEVSDTARQLLQSGVFPLDGKTGMFKSQDPALQRYADELNREAQFQRAQAKKLISNPEAFFEETGVFEKFKPQELNRDELKQELLEEIKRDFAQQQKQQTVQSEIRQVLPELYEVDERGGLRRNAAGLPIPKGEAGQVFDRLLNNPPPFVQDTEEARVSYALSMVRSQFAKAEPTPQEKRQEKQETWLQKVPRNGRNRLSSSDASIAEEAAREANNDGFKRNGDLWDEARREAESELV